MINQRMADAWAKVEGAIRAKYSGPVPLEDEASGEALIGQAMRFGTIAGPTVTLAQQLLRHADDLDTIPDEFVGRCESLVQMIENPEKFAAAINVGQHVNYLRQNPRR